MHGYFNPRQYSSGVVTIFEYERGLLYSSGVFLRVLNPGRHRIWAFSHRHITVIDVRQNTLSVLGQKTFTSEPLPVTVNLGVDWRIVDPAVAVHASQNLQAKLYEHTQREARTLIAKATVVELIGDRTSFNAALTESLRPHGEELGLQILSAELLDLILAPSTRELVGKEAETRMRARAALAGAREEVATLRAMANAARILRDHPEIARLRELDLMAEFSRRPGNSLVLGAQSPLVKAPRTSEEPPSETD